jgi:hypothetical protein
MHFLRNHPSTGFRKQSAAKNVGDAQEFVRLWFICPEHKIAANNFIICYSQVINEDNKYISTNKMRLFSWGIPIENSI